MDPSRLVLLQCFGSSHALRAAAEALAAALGPVLGLPTVQVAGEPLELPEGAHYPARGQWLASGLTEVLKAVPAPPRALRLGLTDADLFDTGLNFVFGEASPGLGVVVSTARLDEAFYGLSPAPPALRQRRARTSIPTTGENTARSTREHNLILNFFKKLSFSTRLLRFSVLGSGFNPL
jgi:hypothetical protein